jgi:hypothetical protein
MANGENPKPHEVTSLFGSLLLSRESFDCFSPFRAGALLESDSQGVALGCRLLRRWRRILRPKPWRRSTYSAAPSREVVTHKVAPPWERRSLSAARHACAPLRSRNNEGHTLSIACKACALSAVSGPKAREISAQGNALGVRSKTDLALKGRNSVRSGREA